VPGGWCPCRGPSWGGLDQPGRQCPGAGGGRRAIDARAEESPGQREAARHPVRLARVGAQAADPVEAGRPSFERDGEVHEPDLPEQAVAERVERQQAQMVLGSRYPDRARAEMGGTLDAATGTHRLPVGLVVLNRYRAGARWRPRRLSPAVGALALLANTVPARRRPARALAAIQAVVLRAPVFQGTRGEAAETARALLDALRPPVL
jgi:hypothetical protein